VDLDPATAAWRWSSLRVLDLAAGASVRFSTSHDEILVLPLAGSCHVRCGPEQVRLAGRRSVWEAPTDFAYAPPGSDLVLSSEHGGRFALPGARALGSDLPFRHHRADGVQVELRGAGNCSRRVANYCMPATFAAERLICCEVFTPSGNWSSYPPHKHDEPGPQESELEEIYYFEVAPGPSGESGIAYQRVYGTPRRPIDMTVEVHDGDVVLVPHGYHGPSMAAPGYDLYYLNVMAGPGERAWLVTFDPAHEWARAAWATQAVDPRLALPAAPASRAGQSADQSGGLAAQGRQP